LIVERDHAEALAEMLPEGKQEAALDELYGDFYKKLLALNITTFVEDEDNFLHFRPRGKIYEFYKDDRGDNQYLYAMEIK
jgi:hypothetical protein